MSIHINSKLLILFLFVSHAVLASDSVKKGLEEEMVAGMCNIDTMCSKVNQQKCIQIHEKAFAKCASSYSVSPDNYMICIIDDTSAGLQKLMESIDPMSCNTGAGVYQGDEPLADELSYPENSQFFTTNTHFLTGQADKTLYTDRMQACQVGAQRYKEEMEKRQKVRVTVTITEAAQRYEPIGEGDPSLSHKFSAPTYNFGECIGTAETLMLESNGIFHKGEVVGGDYEDTLYIVVPCSTDSRQRICQ